MPVQDGVHHAGWIAMCIIQWLEYETDDVVAGLRTFKLLPDPQSILAADILRPLRLLPYPKAFPDGGLRFCGIPYGKTGAFNVFE